MRPDERTVMGEVGQRIAVASTRDGDALPLGPGSLALVRLERGQPRLDLGVHGHVAKAGELRI